MPTVEVPVQLTVEHLLSVVKQLSPNELHTFTRKLAEWQSQLASSGKQVDTKAEEEVKLIQATQARLPMGEEKRLKQLCQKSERGTLTQQELEEYRALAQQAEQLDVTRTEALAELVKLKGKSVHAVMKEIGWEEAPFE